MTPPTQDLFGSLLQGDYPDSWDDYVGQERAKRALLVAAHASAVMGKNMQHTLICSPVPGSGKTALVQLTVRQMGRRVHVVSGAINANRARIMFSQVEDGDIIFYDEFHKVMEGGKKNAEWLLHFMENGVLMTAFGAETVPKVTLIGATTDKGAIAGPILDRFVVIDLEPYTDTEAAQIVDQLAAKVLTPVHLPVVDKVTAAALAAAASNQPRMMRRLLETVRDLAVTGQIPAPPEGGYDIGEALDMADVTPDGLTREARTYLRIMYVEMRGEPVGGAQLKNRMGLVGRGLELIEMLLVSKDLIAYTKQGRMLTGAGMKRATELQG